RRLRERDVRLRRAFRFQLRASADRQAPPNPSRVIERLVAWQVDPSNALQSRSLSRMEPARAEREHHVGLLLPTSAAGRDTRRGERARLPSSTKRPRPHCQPRELARIRSLARRAAEARAEYLRQPVRLVLLRRGEAAPRWVAAGDLGHAAREAPRGLLRFAL